MAREHDAFGLALMQLRSDLRDGRIRPGEPLATTDLARRLKISATPVREALARLAGEGLLDDRRGRGVCALRYDVAEIEAFYRLHHAYVGLALTARGSAWRPRETQPAVPDRGSAAAVDLWRSRTEQFWSSIVLADAGVIGRAHRVLTDQLAPIRLIEPQVLSETTEELDHLLASAATAAETDLHAAIARYHQRRGDAARALAAALSNSPALKI